MYAGTGATAADFPADTAGKIVLMDQGANTAARNTQVANAVAAGAVAVILGNTGTNSAPTTTITITPAQPDLADPRWRPRAPRLDQGPARRRVR